MHKRLPALAAAALTLAACGGGGASPLGYGLPSPNEVRYAYGDTTIVLASMMGQSMEVAMRATADYAVSFTESAAGLNVSLTVEDLQGSVSQPLGAPITMDGSDVDGAIVFSLDRRGRATVVSSPEVSVEAGQMVSALATANSFFPRLPDRAVAAGDEWVDTISFEGDEALGPVSSTSVLRYTVVGDTTVAGRALLHIAFTGDSELANTMDMQGMQIAQASSVEVEGYVLWDVHAGVPFEMFRSGSGEGTVTVPIAPAPLPIQVQSIQRARIQGT